MKHYYLTTKDNRFDPSTEFEAWLNEDKRLALKNDRRDTCSMLALYAIVSNNLSDKAMETQKKIAIEQILKLDPFDIYRMVVSDK